MAGGALGACFRYFVANYFKSWSTDFPYSTLVVNLLGSFLIGIFIPLIQSLKSGKLEWHGFLVIGLLGAFTTFSAFSLDVLVLFQKQYFKSVCMYLFLSNILGLTLCFIGYQVSQRLLPAYH